jgi:hypothetical protein
MFYDPMLQIGRLELLSLSSWEIVNHEEQNKFVLGGEFLLQDTAK